MEIQFTALMPLYAGSPLQGLVLSVQSIIEQSLPPTEFLIVEDGPLSDEVLAFLDQTVFPFPTRRIRLEKNSGIGVALQRGLVEAQYPWIARVDADDISAKNRFKICVVELVRNEGLDILGSWTVDIEDASHTKRDYFVRQVPAKHSEILKHARFRTPFNHQSVFFKKQLALEVGGYRNYYYYEDWDLWLRMFQAGARGQNIQEALVLVQQNYVRRSGWASIAGDYKALSGFLRNKHHTLPVFLINFITRLLARLIPPYTKYIYRNLLRKKVKELPKELVGLV